jgi:hypothetical protein
MNSRITTTFLIAFTCVRGGEFMDATHSMKAIFTKTFVAMDSEDLSIRNPWPLVSMGLTPIMFKRRHPERNRDQEKEPLRGRSICLM